ncbi:putative zinc finger, CCHC-type, retrotransposon gag domain protein [Tanacetum coccineum]
MLSPGRAPPKSTKRIGSTSNAHSYKFLPLMIITSVDEPVSQVEELSRNVHYLLRESGIKGKEAKGVGGVERWEIGGGGGGRGVRHEIDRDIGGGSYASFETVLGASRTRDRVGLLWNRMIAGSLGSRQSRITKKKRASSSNTGVVGLTRWMEKIEQVFGTCKCAEQDKVVYAASTFEGRALTWWNGNVRTLGLENANKIPWTEFKEMMTTEYCPDTEIQKMEQELWNLTLKGDDIETYINRFHELSLMCPELVPTENKKIKKFIKGFPERIKGNITSSKPSSLHDAVNMARELVEQSVQGKASRSSDGGKKRNRMITAETTK